MPESPYNPLDIENLGESLAIALEATEPLPLGSLPQFSGSGVYAIYYVGDFPAYAPLSAANRNDRWSQPIYVGKAVPPGTRTANVANYDPAGDKSLRSRLRQHALSIGAAENLEIDDFYARWLVTEPVWIPLAESTLISRSACVWNRVLAGFGVNAQGKGRISGSISAWDMLHPGRSRQGVRSAKASMQPDALAREVHKWLEERV